MSELKDQIENYRKGKLTPAQMHALEKRALSDPFLADALEGASGIDPDEFADDVGELNSRLQGRKPILLSWRIAAGIMIVAAGLALVFIPFGDNEQIIAENKDQAPTEAAATDSTADTSGPDLLSMEKADAQPEADRTRRVPVAPPSTTGAAAGLTSTSTAGDLSALSATEAKPVDEIADTEEELSEVVAGVLDDSTTVTIADADAALPKKQEMAESLSEERSAASRTMTLSAPVKTITGQVTIADDGLPLPGVNVLVKGTDIGTVTDFNGRYSIEVPANRNQLSFSFIGMLTNEVRLNDSEVVDVKLTEDVSQLSEVVVTGYALPGNNDEPVIRLAEPIGGRKAYDKYLEDELRYPQEALENNIKGRVTVQFTVDTRGIIGEFEVIKKLGYGCDEEVIRLVKEGPKWLPTTQNSVPVESIVRVRMKFDPKKKK